MDRAEEDRLDREALLTNLAFRRRLIRLASTRAWNTDSHGVALVSELAFARMHGAKPDTRCFRKNDGNIDIELLLSWSRGEKEWGEFDIKSAVKTAHSMPVNIKHVQPQRIYVMAQHHDHEDFWKCSAEMLGWLFGREVVKYPIAYQWMNNDKDVHLVPVGKLRGMDELKAAYHGRWRWNDMPGFPKHPPEGFPARYR
jgi:hypothetical protein